MLSLNTKFTIKARAPLQRRICRQENSRSASPRSGKLAGAMAVEVEGGGKRFRSRTNRPASSSVLRNILLFSTWDIYVHTQNRGNIHTDPSSSLSLSAFLLRHTTVFISSFSRAFVAPTPCCMPTSTCIEKCPNLRLIFFSQIIRIPEASLAARIRSQEWHSRKEFIPNITKRTETLSPDGCTLNERGLLFFSTCSLFHLRRGKRLASVI